MRSREVPGGVDHHQDHEPECEGHAHDPEAAAGMRVADDRAATREHERESRDGLRCRAAAEAGALVPHSDSSGTPTILRRRGEAGDREVANLVRGRPQRLPVRTVAVRWRQRRRHRGEERAQRRPHDVSQTGVTADGLAQEPGAVRDVPLLVVMDLRIPVHEATEQSHPLEVAGDEVERGEAQRALDHHVVGRDEGDLRVRVPRLGHEPLVRLDQGLVEDRGERRRELFARAGHVLADRPGIGNHLVLIARVELHVARLVHLLGGQERGLLLGAVGGDQSRELGGDALLRHHQRRERPEDEGAVLARHRPPLVRVGLQIDRERAPLLLLPVAVQGLRIVQVDFVAGHGASH